MKVLGVLAEMRPSGAEVGLAASASEWRRQGVGMDLLATAATPGPYASALRAAGYPIHHIPLKPAAAFAPAYLALLRRGRYDLVHVHPEYGNILTSGIARAAAIPTVRTCHNVRNFRGALRLERHIQRALLRRAGVKHIAVGASVAASEWSQFRNPSIRIMNCFDDQRFRPPTHEQRTRARKVLGVQDSDFIITTIGNCAHQKNHEMAFEALALLDGGGRPMRYLHAGTEQPDGAERRLAERLGVSASVRFLGPVDNVVEVLHAADCYVMPSRFEGLPLAALEALGCGLPCILVDAPGLRDLREFFPDQTWIPLDVHALRAALVERCDSHVPDGPHSEAVSSVAHQLFSTRSYVSQHVDLFNQLVLSR